MRHMEVMLAIGHHFPKGGFRHRILDKLFAFEFSLEEITTSISWMDEECVSSTRSLFGKDWIFVDNKSDLYIRQIGEVTRLVLLSALAKECILDGVRAVSYVGFLERREPATFTHAVTGYHLGVLASEGFVLMREGRVGPTVEGVERLKEHPKMPAWLCARGSK